MNRCSAEALGFPPSFEKGQGYALEPSQMRGDFGAVSTVTLHNVKQTPGRELVSQRTGAFEISTLVKSQDRCYGGWGLPWYPQDYSNSPRYPFGFDHPVRINRCKCFLTTLLSPWSCISNLARLRLDRIFDCVNWSRNRRNNYPLIVIIQDICECLERWLSYSCNDTSELSMIIDR